MATTEVCLTEICGAEVSIVAGVGGVETTDRFWVAAVNGAEVSIFTREPGVYAGFRCVGGIAIVYCAGVAVIAEQEREGTVTKNIIADIGSTGVSVFALLLNVQACSCLVYT